MPRARFHKLPPEQRDTIVRVTVDELVAQGFTAASLNRIIEAAGISKGSMYYYFDDKEDLYAHVARVELGRLFEEAGPFPVPSVESAEAFWEVLAHDYERILSALFRSPRVAALARGWMAASSNPALQRAQREMEAEVLPWFEQTLVAGQRVGAVRCDVPVGLLLAVVLGMGQAMDTWLMSQPLEESRLRATVPTFVGMFQRVLTPEKKEA